MMMMSLEKARVWMRGTRFARLLAIATIAVGMAFVLAHATTAFSIEPLPTGPPYLEPTETVSPHGGYTTTTNKCKYCHAVHLATGAYMLTRANTRSQTCDYCHGDGAGAGTNIVANYEGHTMGSGMAYFGPAPNGVDGDTYYVTPANPFDCMTCHSVHANPERIVRLADLDKDYLLLRNPDGTDTTYNSSNTLSQWCADCHPGALASHETTLFVNGQPYFSHDSSATTPTTLAVRPYDGINNGPTCRMCHASSQFPHGQGGTGRDMLKDSFDGISLDDVCNDCHAEEALP
jgi:predicted CXXCH cytochrome family protein